MNETLKKQLSIINPDELTLSGPNIESDSNLFLRLPWVLLRDEDKLKQNDITWNNTYKSCHF